MAIHPKNPRKKRLFRFPWRTAGQIGAEVDEEIGFHLEMRAAELERRGMTAHAAREQALAEFGDVDGTRAFCREMDLRDERRTRLADRLEGVLQDARFAARSLRKTPGFTAAAAVTLALGVGATTAVFSVVDAFLLRPLPVAAPERLVTLEVREAEGDLKTSSSYPYVQDWMRAAGGVAEIAALHPGELSFTDGAGAAELVWGVDATDNYFRVLGVSPALGRFFAPGDDAAGAMVAVLGHAFWTRRFGADPGVVGRTVRLNGQPVEVIGIAPAGFAGTIAGMRTDLWVPVGAYPRLNPGGDLNTRGRHSWLAMIGRLRPGVTHAQGAAALAAMAPGIAPEFADDGAAAGAQVERLTGVPPQARGTVVGLMTLLLATAALVLLIAATNVGGMLLARASARRREIAIRLAMGAGRGRLARLLLAESLLLFLLGGAGGTLLAVWAAAALRGWRPVASIPVALDVGVDLKVLAFALGVSLLTGVLCGLVPALAASRPVLVPALKDGAGTGRRTRLRGAFVVGQLAMSLLLLVTAGLFARALQGALSIDPGFRPRGVAVGEVRLRPHGYDEARGAELYRQLLERLRARPGVRAATLASVLPLSGNFDATQVWAAGGPSDPAARVRTGFAVVEGGYFGALSVPLRAGRVFGDEDRSGAPLVAVVNETLARRLWPGENAVGKRLDGGRDGEVEVVGVVADGKYQSLRDAPEPYMYLPFGQSYQGTMTVVVRHDGPAAPVLAAMHAELRALDASVPLARALPMEVVVGESLTPQRMAAAMVGAFGTVGLLLAAVGVYGVLAYQVSQRTREIGVRMALGAGRASVLRLVLRQGMGLAVVGIGIGLALALAASRALAGMLYGLSATDPATFVAVPLLVCAAAFLASWLPARRATRVDPLVALRAE
jgi:predicted permease